MIQSMYRSPLSSSSTPAPGKPLAVPVVPAASRPAASHLRLGLLVAGSVLLLATPLVLLEPAAYWQDDPELFRLLRGMAVIKGVLALLAASLVWWRLGRLSGPGFAAAYIGGVWVLALATGLIWQLTLVLPASGLFHAATLMLLVTAWRDTGSRLADRRTRG